MKPKPFCGLKNLTTPLASPTTCGGIPPPAPRRENHRRRHRRRGSLRLRPAAAIAEATSANPAAVTKSAAAAVAAAFLESAWLADCFFAESVTFIAAARAAVAFAPSVETHARPNFRVPSTT